jgi:hypothetical protein
MALNGDKWAIDFVTNRTEGLPVQKQILTDEAAEARKDADYALFRAYQGSSEKQWTVLMNPAKRVFIRAGRRAGKTVYYEKKARGQLTAHPHSRVLYIGLTIGKAMDLMWLPMTNGLRELGSDFQENKSEGTITLSNGSLFKVGGNSSVAEREKNRGPYWDLVIIDEAQSHTDLISFIQEILDPELADRDGTLIMGGTAPKVKGHDWDVIWANESGKWPGFRYPSVGQSNWTIEDNPYIQDHEGFLERKRIEKQWTEASPTYQREWLGRAVYDEDALVYRLKDNNYFTDTQLDQWVKSQPVTDIRFTAGLDYGFEDADGFAIICYSTHKPERWLIWDYKARRTGVATIAEQVRKGIDWVENHPIFKHSTVTVPAARPQIMPPGAPAVETIKRKFHVFADTAGGTLKISYDLQKQYGLPMADAFKAGKDQAIEILQEEVRLGYFKVRAGGVFADEALRTIFARDNDDNLTREIDEQYHPDLLDAVLYAMRPVWHSGKTVIDI